LAPRIGVDRLTKIREVHSSQGRHEVEETPFPAWVPPEVLREAGGLTEQEARQELPGVIPEVQGSEP
ncbi:MAG: hypothetical protein V3R89_05135, partial [Thermoanaerobaculia bacterium]